MKKMLEICRFSHTPALKVTSRAHRGVISRDVRGGLTINRLERSAHPMAAAALTDPEA